MDESVRDKYVEAGRIAREAREKAAGMVEPGASATALVEAVEAFIRDEGAQPAFPVNVSVDDVAAHYTPGLDDDLTLQDGRVVNVDVGVHVDGFIGDTATTVDLSGQHRELVDAAQAALDAALDLVEPGVRVGELGAAIQDAIEGAGYKPIRNLSGHGLAQYVQHTGDTIPNVATDSDATLQAGDAVAIEPFATTGAGRVKDGGPGNIYRVDDGTVRDRTARKVLGEAKDRFRNLPFTPRWCESVPAPRLGMALRTLVNGGAFHSYDVLKEADGGLVAQEEHTVLVLDDPVVTTR